MDRYALLTCCIIICSTQICMAAGAPSWVAQGRHPAYPSSEFLTGVGVSMRTRDTEGDVIRSEANARAAIAKQIQVNLKEGLNAVSEQSSFRNGMGLSSGETMHEQITVHNQEQVQITLEGVELVERYYDNKTACYYVLGVLHRQRTAARLRGDAEGLLLEVGSLERTVEKALANNEIVTAIKNLVIAVTRYEMARQKYQIAAILGSNLGPISLSPSPYDKLDQIKRGMTVICVSGDDQSARIGWPLQDPIKIKVVYDKKVSVAGLPLSVQFPGGGQTIFHTNTMGLANVQVPEVPRTGRQKNTIHIELAWTEIIRDTLGEVPMAWADRPRGPKLLIQYSIRTEATSKVQIVTCTDNDSMISMDDVLVQKVIHALKTAGFMVQGVDRCTSATTSAEWLAHHSGKIDLLVMAKGDTHISSMRAGMPVYRARLVLSCFDLRRGGIISAQEGAAIAGASDNRKAAERAMGEVADDLLPVFIKQVQENLQ